MKSMTTIGDRLRKARESLGRTITDISTATRINRKYLEQIEQGVTPSQGPTYVRAFIRAYAQEVGVDPTEFFEPEPEPPQPEPESPPRETAAAAPQQPRAQPEKRPPEEPPEELPGDQPASAAQRSRQRKILVIISVLIVAGLLITILVMQKERSKPSVQEISFADALKEQEARVSPSGAADSAKNVKGPAPAETRGANDSLSLDGVANESVWVKVVVDGQQPSEYTFPPMYRMRWKAKNSFTISIGNGQGASFTLNGLALGSLGPAKKPAKNVSLTWATVDKLRKDGEAKAQHGRR